MEKAPKSRHKEALLTRLLKAFNRIEKGDFEPMNQLMKEYTSDEIVQEIKTEQPLPDKKK